MYIKVLTTLLFVFASVNAFAYQNEIDKFFGLYEAGKVADAVDSIYSSNKWIVQKVEDVQNVKTQLQNLQNFVGEYHGKVRIGSTDIEDRLIYVSYLVLFERQPVRLEFIFYRPQEDWVIYSFSFDDSIDDELTEFSREKLLDQK